MNQEYDEVDELFDDIDLGREGNSWGYSLGLDKLEEIIEQEDFEMIEEELKSQKTEL